MGGNLTASAPRTSAAAEEQEIVRASDRYLRNIAEFVVGDLADITGDPVQASPNWRERLTPGEGLSEIASLRATTLQGLAAKARVVKVILDLDDADSNIEEDEFAFLDDFAEEAKAFFAKTAVEDRRTALAP
jgi:hypothetical protein